MKILKSVKISLSYEALTFTVSVFKIHVILLIILDNQEAKRSRVVLAALPVDS